MIFLNTVNNYWSAPQYCTLPVPSPIPPSPCCSGLYHLSGLVTMTSSNKNIFRVTGHLCGEFTVTGEFPHKGQWSGALMFSLICDWINGWVNNGEAGDLGRHHAHYGVIVMSAPLLLTCLGGRESTRMQQISYNHTWTVVSKRTILNCINRNSLSLGFLCVLKFSPFPIWKIVKKISLILVQTHMPIKRLFV